MNAHQFPTSKQVKHVTVVTGTRAEFGILRSVIAAIDKHPKLQLRLIATGTHLTTGTYRDITKAGYQIDSKIRMQKKGEVGHAADAAAFARGVSGLAKDFATHSTDIVLVLGDRIEAFAAATAAAISGLHLAHIHGGDRAEGVADESMRHAITKLAHIHFPASRQSATRIIKLGELKQSIHLHGSPSIDDLESSISQLDNPIDYIILQHPVGNSNQQEQKHMMQTLKAVTQLAKQHSQSIMVLNPNHDPGVEGVLEAINTHQQSQAANNIVCYKSHLPRPDFLSCLAQAKAIIGNSSAALIEAAALKTPAVNIGPRQNGREKPRSVIDCSYGRKPVQQAIIQALNLNLRRMAHPYGNGSAGQNIAKTLANLDLNKISLKKQNTF